MFVDTKIHMTTNREDRNLAGFGQMIERDLDAERAKNGDLESFRNIFNTHIGRVYALCLRMTGNEELAKDMAQMTFIRVWESLDTFRGDSSIATWIHRIAVNVVIGAIRRSSPFDEGADSSRLDSLAVNPQTELRLDLERAITLLPAAARVVFVLHDVEGFTHEEIAVRLGVTPGTCKSQLHRARKLLQTALRQ